MIGLPANIFYGTGIPTCIMVFKKCRETEEVLFVDASRTFQRGKNQNWLSEADVDTIVDGFRDRRKVERFSNLVTREEIAANDYNLNIPRYVDTFEKEEEIDLGAVTARLKAIEADMGAVDAQIRAFCEELGLEVPV